MNGRVNGLSMSRLEECIIELMTLFHIFVSKLEVERYDVNCELYSFSLDELVDMPW